MIIEHAILRSIDSDCDLTRVEGQDFEVNAEGDARDLWIGCGTKTVGEVAMVAGAFPVPIWADTSEKAAYAGQPADQWGTIQDALPPLGPSIFGQARVGDGVGVAEEDEGRHE